VLDFERRHEPLAPPAYYRRRLLKSSLLAGGVIGVSLAIGILGYHYFGGIESWVDCLYSASMILGGMGPVNPLETPVAKLFASFYALFSGLVFIGVASVLLAPFAHRILHRFHLDE
jgi:hypothetical protein